MATKKRGLGRGLDALLGNAHTQAAEPATKPPAGEDSGAVDENNSLKHLPVEFIQPGRYQPRHNMHDESLEDLANSIKAQGVMQPIVVRSISSNKYEIVAGERRWRACQLAGLDTIPVIVKQVADEAAVAMALIENIQRENLNPIEEATALQRLIEEFGLTQQEAADAVGKSRTTVTNLLRLMGLNVDVRQALERGDLEMGHARALLALPQEKQPEVARTVSGKGLSVRQTEALVRKLLAQKNKASTAKKLDPDIRHLQDSLSEKLGANVAIQHTAKGKGKLILKYNSLEQLEGILDHIK
ncbi:MAG: ParB/RepB/Spo0J family partition protein [Gammaproteobacteria bacterium]|nr:ParB/RepB/Spo0J family partition protein [Gammaproteobacteria bacterium]